MKAKSQAFASPSRTPRRVRACAKAATAAEKTRQSTSSVLGLMLDKEELLRRDLRARSDRRHQGAHDGVVPLAR